MKEKEKRFKRCPRCNLKTFASAKVCGRCELNFDKFNIATNEEGKRALRCGEKERVVMTDKLPSDLDKWQLFTFALFLGWSGAHLWKVGRLNRAIAHSIGLVLLAGYVIISCFDVGNVLWNIGNFCGAFWAITWIYSVIDIFFIAINKFKVPVSLKYKEEK